MVIFDDKFNILHEITADFEWVQDAITFSNFLLIANVNKGRIEIYDRLFRKLGEICYSPDDRRLSAMIAITSKQAKAAFLNS